MGEKSQTKRILHYDLLRVIAAFSVVMLHVSAQFWYDLDVNGPEWKLANSYNALSRYGVPIFVMLSGALFLGRAEKVDIKRLYTHNILRFVVIYIVWSCAYGLLDCAGFNWSEITWKDIVREMMGGRYHLWFLPMIAGIYVLLPVLDSWIRHAEKRNVEYFLLLFFVLQILAETAKALFGMDDLTYLLGLIDVQMVCSYIGYFVLGYYIAHIGLPRKYHRWIYLAVIPAAILNVVLGNGLAVRAGYPVGAIYDSYGLFTFVIVAALFLFCTEKLSRIHYSERAEKVLKELSMGTLGVYLMHVGLIEVLQKIGLHSMTLPIVIGIPVHAIVCFVVCFLFAAILRRIPGVGKYIC